MIKPIYYMQNDPRWSSHDYSAKGEKRTIASSGCGPACMAMIVASLKKKDIKPPDTADWSKKHGYKFKNQGTAYSYFAAAGKKYGISVKQINGSSVYHKPNAEAHTIAKKALAAGDWLIACMGPGNWTSGGHYVLVFLLNDNKVYINDPASKATIRTVSSWNKFKNEVKYYFHVYVPELTVKTKKNPLGMYAEKSLKSKRLAKILKGKRVKLIKFGDKTFDAYAYGKKRGYCRKKYLK